MDEDEDEDEDKEDEGGEGGEGGEEGEEDEPSKGGRQGRLGFSISTMQPMLLPSHHSTPARLRPLTWSPRNDSVMCWWNCLPSRLTRLIAAKA